MESGFGYDRDVDIRIVQELSEELNFVDGPGVRRGNGWEAVSKRRAEDGGLGSNRSWARSRCRAGDCRDGGVAVSGWVGDVVAA